MPTLVSVLMTDSDLFYALPITVMSEHIIHLDRDMFLRPF